MRDFEVDALLLHPLLEAVRTGKHPDAIPLAQAVAGFLPDHAGAVLKAVLGDGGRRDPELLDLDAARALVLGCVVEPEEVARPLAMIGVEVGEADDVEVVAIDLAEVGTDFGGEIAARVVGIVGIALVAEIDEHFALVSEVDEQAVGVAERERSNVGGH